MPNQKDARQSGLEEQWSTTKKKSWNDRFFRLGVVPGLPPHRCAHSDFPPQTEFSDPLNTTGLCLGWTEIAQARGRSLPMVPRDVGLPATPPRSIDARAARSPFQDYPQTLKAI
jgi:hypothetical protein